VIVFCVVVHGIAAAGDLSKVGRVGVRTLIYFEVITTIALVLGPSKYRLAVSCNACNSRGRSNGWS